MRVLNQAVEEHNPQAIYALFSGGHDSLCATAITAKHPAFTAAAFINTGTGIPRTVEFVRETCQKQGWPRSASGSAMTDREQTFASYQTHPYQRILDLLERIEHCRRTVVDALPDRSLSGNLKARNYTAQLEVDVKELGQLLLQRHLDIQHGEDLLK